MEIFYEINLELLEIGEENSNKHGVKYQTRISDDKKYLYLLFYDECLPGWIAKLSYHPQINQEDIFGLCYFRIDNNKHYRLYVNEITSIEYLKVLNNRVCNYVELTNNKIINKDQSIIKTDVNKHGLIFRIVEEDILNPTGYCNISFYNDEEDTWIFLKGIKNNFDFETGIIEYSIGYKQYPKVNDYDNMWYDLYDLYVDKYSWLNQVIDENKKITDYLLFINQKQKQK